MNNWQWILLGGVACCVIVIVLILVSTEDEPDPNPESWDNHWDGADK